MFNDLQYKVAPAYEYLGLRTESRRNICFEIQLKVRDTNQVKHKVKKNNKHKVQKKTNTSCTYIKVLSLRAQQIFVIVSHFIVYSTTVLVWIATKLLLFITTLFIIIVILLILLMPHCLLAYVSFNTCL